MTRTQLKKAVLDVNLLLHRDRRGLRGRDRQGDRGDLLSRHIDPAEVAAVLVRNHGPFTWGPTADEAAHNAVVLEEVARMALLSPQVGSPQAISRELLDKHFLRKHWPGAYYGQKRAGPRVLSGKTAHCGVR